jgi:hypothetical protein
MTVAELIAELTKLPMGALIDIQLVNGGQREIAGTFDPQDGGDMVYILEADVS